MYLSNYALTVSLDIKVFISSIINKRYIMCSANVVCFQIGNGLRFGPLIYVYSYNVQDHEELDCSKS